MKIMTYDRIPDYSHWNGSVDFSVLPRLGINRVLIKATEGTGGVDQRFYENREKAIKALLSWSAYHYFHPELDPVIQAKHFVNSVNSGGLMPTEPLTLDMEMPPNTDPTTSARNALSCLVTIEQLSGLRPIIYTRSTFWKLYYYRAYDWAGFYPLHVAHYKDFSGPLVCLPWSPEGWVRWQYTDRDRGPLYGATSLQVDMSLAIPTEEIVTAPITTRDLMVNNYRTYPRSIYKIGVRELIGEILTQLKPSPRAGTHANKNREAVL